MTKLDLGDGLLLLGAVAVIAGVGLIHLPSAIVVAGLVLIVAAVVGVGARR